MSTNTIIIAIITLIVGAGGGYMLAPEKIATPEGAHMMPDGSVMTGSPSAGMHGAMGDMMAGLEGKTGDEFDQAFLTEMIVHHEGAVDMAEAALQNAKHAEIKTMANAIISAQTGEIAQMKEWLKTWYEQ
jgi:uncharacterized protein (DUF305 family)